MDLFVDEDELLQFFNNSKDEANSENTSDLLENDDKISKTIFNNRLNFIIFMIFVYLLILLMIFLIHFNVKELSNKYNFGETNISMSHPLFKMNWLPEDEDYDSEYKEYGGELGCFSFL